ncbi:MAG: lytic transglycosylase domain-containing protein [Chitinispirillaceae bacterium]|nr:lytic transglycosylase domain-containing protein [Chitinispirillaceae bacterium]
MQPPRSSQMTRRAGLIIRHRALWLSELLAGTTVALLLVCFMSMTLVILLNSFSIRTFDRNIAALEKEKIQRTHAISGLREQTRILALMRKLTGSTVSDRTLCEVAGLVHRSSVQFGYDPLLLVAVIKVEGVFDPMARGRFISGAHSGALGLMQLKFETAQDMARQLKLPLRGEEDLFDPEINLVLGIAYLTQLIKRFKSFKLGLLAYNQGPGVIRQSLTNKEPLSIAYYQKVLHYYYRLKKMSRASETASGDDALPRRR